MSDPTMNAARAINGNGTIPTGKWEFFCWISGQFAKGGPIALVLLIVLAGGGYGLDKYLSNQNAILEKLAAGQVQMQMQIAGKNETIGLNHELLVRGEERDRAVLEALKQGNELTSRISSEMIEANATMAEAPERGRKTVELLEKMVEGLQGLVKNYQTPPMPNNGGA
jgi:hypothetical protein